jgi:hypothetical protein
MKRRRRESREKIGRWQAEADSKTRRETEEEQLEEVVWP